MFDKLAGSDQEIDSEELQDMLTASFSKGTLAYNVLVYLSPFSRTIKIVCHLLGQDLLLSVFSIQMQTCLVVCFLWMLAGL